MIQYLTTELEKKKLELIARYDELGMRATGKFADSLEVEVEQNGSMITARLSGAAYGIQLSEGRAPGQMPPTQAIEDWIRVKGITNRLETEISISSLAFLIARKIAREGTEYFKQGGTDLISSVFTPEWIDEILNGVYQLNVDIFVKTILDEIRQVALAA